jgi:nucleoside-diphosphate-sugar epimerase
VKLFVTGAGGFLGRTIVVRLAAAGHRIVALFLPGEEVPWEHHAAGNAPLHVDIVRGDITRPVTLAGLAAGCDGVVHLAGAVGYGQTFARCEALNRDGTANVAEAAAATGARRFLHLSSVSVYGRVADEVLTEDAPLRKIGDPYGDTKIDAEAILARHAAAGTLDLTMLRPTVIYGPGDDKFLPRLIENLRSGRARVIGRGNNTVDLVHVEDAADMVVRVLAEPRSIGRTYNLAHPANPSWRRLLEEAAGLLGVAPPRGHLPYAAAYVAAGLMEATAALTGAPPRLTRYAVRVVGRQYHYSCERARHELGFQCRRSLLEELPALLASPGLPASGGAATTSAP